MLLNIPFKGNFPITQGFGENPGSYHYICRADGSHNGIDYGLPTGTPVLAAAPGKVIITGMDNTGYGLHVRVLLADGTLNLYGHLSQISVSVGAAVQQGTILGLSGSTGNATGPHLHFEVRTNPNDCTTAIDPAPLLAANQPQPTPQPQSQDNPPPAPVPPAGKQPLFKVKVVADVLHVRSSPEVTADNLLGQVEKGAEFTVYDLTGPTIWVQVGDGQYCALSFNGDIYLTPTALSGKNDLTPRPLSLKGRRSKT
jgi:hypothetical protein